MAAYPEATVTLVNEPPKQTRRFGMLPAIRALRKQLEGLSADEIDKLPSANPKPLRIEFNREEAKSAKGKD